MSLYRVVRIVVYAVARAAWRIRIEGAERIPRHGPFILAPSHRSNLDSFLAPLASDRRMRFMAKKEVWKSRVIGNLAERLGAFPVDRGGADRAALRQAMACLEAGEPLVIFPEGTRRQGARIEDLHDGAAWVAARLGVPIVPVGIAGSEEILARGRKLPRLAKVDLVVGDPIDPPRRDGPVKRSDVKELTGAIQVALQKALDDAAARRDTR